MAYIGKSPIIGNFVKLDAITAVNGQAAYTMQNGGANFTDYESVNQFLVSLNGTIQAPTSSFTVSGSTLTFASNLSTGDVIDFIMVFGNSLSAGTPTDATVTAAKLNDDIISGQTALASEPADTDEFLVSDAGALKRIDYSLIKGSGKLLQIQNMSTTGESSTSGSSFIDTGLTDTITCSSSSNKVLIFPSFPHRTSNTSGNAIVTVERAISGGATTVLSSGSLGFAHTYETNFTMTSFFVLDEPNTTSEITYTIQLRSDNASATVYVGRSNATSQLFLFEIGA